jgi:hypothetical protein
VPTQDQNRSERLHKEWTLIVSAIIAHVGSAQAIRILRHTAEILEKHAKAHGHTPGKVVASTHVGFGS